MICDSCIYFKDPKPPYGPGQSAELVENCIYHHKKGKATDPACDEYISVTLTREERYEAYKAQGLIK